MGHADIRTTERYIINKKDDEDILLRYPSNLSNFYDSIRGIDGSET